MSRVGVVVTVVVEVCSSRLMTEIGVMVSPAWVLSVMGTLGMPASSSSMAVDMLMCLWCIVFNEACTVSVYMYIPSRLVFGT